MYDVKILTYIHKYAVINVDVKLRKTSYVYGITFPIASSIRDKRYHIASRYYDTTFKRKFVRVID